MTNGTTALELAVPQGATEATFAGETFPVAADAEWLRSERSYFAGESFEFAIPAH